eukprot:Lithocolla_globosa_v1_NODE_8505_length_812_cov_10.668428.p2 type:complete len:107 gc:universal NODE_8505_length_812_cov_10.668428:147-467(+)
MCFLHSVLESLSFCEIDGSVLRVESQLQVKCLARVRRRSPTHHRILPTLLDSILYFPITCLVSSRLHHIAGGLVDGDGTIGVFQRSPTDGCHVRVVHNRSGSGFFF